MGLGLAITLGSATRTAPVGGESLYFALLFLLAVGAIVASPLILTTDSFFLSPRMHLLPMPPIARWVSRLLLSNSLRSILTLVVLVWGSTIVLRTLPMGSEAAARLIYLVGCLSAALALSQLVENVIRHRRALILHQLVFLIGLAFWPVVVEFLRTPANFTPPPDWATGPFSLAFPTAPAPGLAIIAIAATPFLLCALLVRTDLWFLARFATRPNTPPSNVRWTAWIAGALTPISRDGSLLFKELLIPLRFLFLRMILVFIVLTAVGAAVAGTPFLLLAIPFWWQPLSTNALGPDVQDGETRYALLGMRIASVLRWRLLATVVLSAVVISITLLLTAATGNLAIPRIGPPDRLMYLAALIYSLSTLPLWAVAGDRYSLRFSDKLEMHTLLPERTRSGGAPALIFLFLMWVGVISAMGLLLLLAGGAVFLMAPGPIDSARALGIAVLAAILNVVVYAIHSRALDDSRR